MLSITKGKGMLIGMIIFLLFYDVLVTVLKAVLGGVITQGIIRFFLTCVLLYFLYQGRKWAKWIMAVLFIVAGTFSCIALFVNFSLILLPGVLYLFFGIALIASKNIKAYMDYKNGVFKSEEIEA